MAAKKKNSTQLRGAVNNIILESLYSGEKYGYEIIREVEEKTNGKIKLKQPSLYSSLKRFEAKNYVKSSWADSDIGGKRHYYSLTDEGLEYYKRNILKEGVTDDEIDDLDNEEDDIVDEQNENEEFSKFDSKKFLGEQQNDEYLEDTIYNEDESEETGYELDTPDTTTDYAQYKYNVDDKINELLKEEGNEKDELLNELYETKNQDEEIYDEKELEKDQLEQEIKNETPVDHEFRNRTPITDELNKISQHAQIDDVEENEIEEDTKAETEENTKPQKTYEIINQTNNAYNDITTKEDSVSDNALDDILYSDPNDEQDSYYIKQTLNEKENKTELEDKPRIYTDKDGITKMYYPDENKRVVNNKIYDNVVVRSNANSIFDKVSSEPVKTKNSIQLDELSDEEREKRTTSFMEKFENRTKELTSNKESAPAKEEKEDVPKVDYKKVLGGLYDADNEVEENHYAQSAVPTTEQEYFYPADHNVETYENGSEEIENETTYENISDDSYNSDYNVKIYTSEKNKKSDNKYLLVNKAKFVFGLTMLVFMLLQVTIMLVTFKNKGVLMDKQYWVFQVSYVVIALVTLFYCIPVFISPNKQATNTFKLGYMLMFGVLSFFIVVILSYAINTFAGMDMDNIKYYIPTLVVPIILALNFVFGPIIYKIITQSKKLY